MWKNIGLGIGGVTLLIVVVVTLGALGLGGRWSNLKVEAWFAPREQNVRREVFEGTKSYNEGKEQELVKYRLEYMRGDESDKVAIASAVRHAFADYDAALLSPELQEFVYKCKNQGVKR